MSVFVIFLLCKQMGKISSLTGYIILYSYSCLFVVYISFGTVAAMLDLSLPEEMETIDILCRLSVHPATFFTNPFYTVHLITSTLKFIQYRP